MKKLFRKIWMLMVVLASSTVIAFADVSNAGQNAGQWVIGQIKWIAMAVIAIACAGFLLKKAWVPFFIFLAIGGIGLFVIAQPEALQSVGQALWSIIVGS